ncbi:MAG: hypothetical protein WCK67_07090 [bacterium]
MKNNEFKKIKNILIENIIRLENFFNQKKAPEHFLEYCKENIATLKQQAIIASNINDFKNIAEEFIKLESSVAHFKNEDICYAIDIFLEETLKTFSFTKYYENLALIPAQSFFSSSKCSFKNNKTFIPVSSFCSNNPIFWSYIIKQTAISCEPLGVKAEDFSECEGFAELFKDIYSDITAVKICGPAHYIAFVNYKTIKALTTNDMNYLKKLFIRNLFLYKNIKLSEAIKYISPYYNDFIKLLKSLADKELLEKFEKIETCSETLINTVGTKITEILNPALIYNNDNLDETHKVIKKLSEESFACSASTNTIDKIRTDYQNELNTDQDNIYIHLNKLKEEPFAPINIINAERFYISEKMEKYPEKNNALKYYEYLNHFIDNLDNLVIKSIETNKIHRILLNEE